MTINTIEDYRRLFTNVQLGKIMSVNNAPFSTHFLHACCEIHPVIETRVKVSNRRRMFEQTGLRFLKLSLVPLENAAIIIQKSNPFVSTINLEILVAHGIINYFKSLTCLCVYIGREFSFSIFFISISDSVFDQATKRSVLIMKRT